MSLAVSIFPLCRGCSREREETFSVTSSMGVLSSMVMSSPELGRTVVVSTGYPVISDDVGQLDIVKMLTLPVEKESERCS